MQTAYTTSEAMGSVSVCVDIDSAPLARNVSVTLRSVAAGQAVGKPLKSHTQKTHYGYWLYRDKLYPWIVQLMIKFSCLVNATMYC